MARDCLASLFSFITCKKKDHLYLLGGIRKHLTWDKLLTPLASLSSLVGEVPWIPSGIVACIREVGMYKYLAR